MKSIETSRLLLRNFSLEDAADLFDEEDKVASQRLCEKLGMRHEGIFKEFVSFENDSHGRPVFVNTRGSDCKYSK